MNDLKKTINTLWMGLTGPQKVSLIGSIFAVCAVLIAVIYFSSKPKMTLLYANLPSEEAAKVMEYLHTKKTVYTLTDGGRSIMVPGDKVYELRLSLAAAGIPRASDTAGGVGFEIFDKATFGMSDFMQKANYYRALQGELARTIRQMAEIEEARVMIVVPEDRLFRSEKREAKASVFVKLKNNRTLSNEQVQAIRFLVANGVEGLQVERVAVVDSSGRALAQNQQNNTLMAASSNQLEVANSLEERLRDKAQTMLDQVLGPGQAVVRVSAELDFDAIQETSEKFDPQSAVVRTESSTNESNKSKTEASGGVSGTTPNLEGSKTAAASPTSSEESRETTNNTYEINRTVETRQRATGRVKRLTVAVLVNMRKAAAAATGAEAGAQTAATTPRTAQEVKALEDIVKQAVGFTQDNTRKDSIQLQEISFADMFATGESAPVAKDMMAEVTTWLPYVSQGFLVLLAIAVFFYFRSILKGSESNNPMESEFSDLISRFKRVDTTVMNGTNGRVNGNPSVLTIEEMTKLMRDNPSNTTQALKQWLTRN